MIWPLALALLIGGGLGLLGGGGSMLMLPLLLYVIGLEPHSAIVASLLVVGLASATAAAVHAARGGIDIRAGFWFGGSSILGAYAGGSTARLLPSTLLLAISGAVMLVTGLGMLRARTSYQAPRTCCVRAAAVGVLVGALTGLVGAGGGFIVVPALTLLCAMVLREAIGTSLLVIALNCFAGFAGAAAHARLPPAPIGELCAIASAGSAAGALLSTRVPPDALRRAFAWVVLATGVVMLYLQLR